MSENSNDKVTALMKRFEEEKARHRQAEMAAETRIRVLENKLKDVALNGSSTSKSPTTSSRTPTIRRLAPAPSTSTSMPQQRNNSNANNRSAASPKRANTPAARTRETVTGVEPRTSDSLFATPTKRRDFSATPVTPTAALRRVKGSPAGSPSGVASLARASSATTSRSERLAAARTKRKEEHRQQQQVQQPKQPGQSSKTTSKSPASFASSASSLHPNSRSRNLTRPLSSSASSSRSATTTRPKTPTGIVSKSTTTVQDGTSTKNLEHEKSWKVFCDIAKNEFTSVELVAVSNETLQQLMDHFSVNDPIERARVEAFWAYLNEMSKSGAPSATVITSKKHVSSLTPATAGQGTGAGTATPHRKRVSELRFPHHPEDFNLRTTVPPDPSLTPRKLLGPDAVSMTPRGCNIDAHNFTCPERKMRSLTLLRSRSPATGNFAASALEHSPSAARKSKKIVADCDAKKTDNHDNERIRSKKFFDLVPGTDTAERIEGKRRASAIPGTKVTGEEDATRSTKKMNIIATPAGGAGSDSPRRGIKILPVDPTASKDARRYTRQSEAASVIRPVADCTLSTVTMERISSSSISAGTSTPAPARSLKCHYLNSNNSSSGVVGAAIPTKFQLKTPFAVD